MRKNYPPSMILWAYHFIALIIGLTLIIHWRLVVFFLSDAKAIISVLPSQKYILIWNRLFSSLTILVFWGLNVSSIIVLYWGRRWGNLLACITILFSTFFIGVSYFPFIDVSYISTFIPWTLRPYILILLPNLSLIFYIISLERLNKKVT